MDTTHRGLSAHHSYQLPPETGNRKPETETIAVS